MGREISSILRFTFIVSTILCWILGMSLLLAPHIVWGWLTIDPIFRVIGAGIFGFSFSSFLAYLRKEWEKVELIVIIDITLLSLTGGAMTWVMIFGGYPPQGWWFVILAFGLLALFLISYFKEVTLNKQTGNRDA